MTNLFTRKVAATSGGSQLRPWFFLLTMVLFLLLTSAAVWAYCDIAIKELESQRQLDVRAGYVFKTLSAISVTTGKDVEGSFVVIAESPTKVTAISSGPVSGFTLSVLDTNGEPLGFKKSSIVNDGLHAATISFVSKGNAMLKYRVEDIVSVRRGCVALAYGQQ